MPPGGRMRSVTAVPACRGLRMSVVVRPVHQLPREWCRASFRELEVLGIRIDSPAVPISANREAVALRVRGRVKQPGGSGALVLANDRVSSIIVLHRHLR